MQYIAIFVWLVTCLVCGGLMHAMLRSAFMHKWVRLLAAPGVTLRKFSMTVAALLTGATVTQVNMYDTAERDIAFYGRGAAGVSRVLVPLAPLFASALALRAVNAALGTPLELSFAPPAIGSFDPGGAVGFARRLLALMVEVVRQCLAADWHSAGLYVLLVFVFSLSLGAGVPFDKFRESFLGVALLVGALAAVCTLFGLGPGAGGLESDGARAPAVAWIASARSFLTATAGAALVMMLCGLLAGVAVGLAARLCEVVLGATRGATGQGAAGKRSARQQNTRT